MRFHFVRGEFDTQGEDPRSHQLRFVNVAPVTIVGAGETEWFEYLFEDYDMPSVDGFGLRYSVSSPLGFSNAVAPSTAICELMLHDGSTLRLDDAFIPSRGEPLGGDISATSSRLLEDDERRQLAEAEIIGWRMKLVAGPGGRLTVRSGASRDVVLAFERDFSDCDGDGTFDFLEVGDACAKDSVPSFRRGDPNADGTSDLNDAIFVLSYLFTGGSAPGCLAAANANGDEAIDISDPTFLLGHFFLGRPAPPTPFPGCGTSELETDAALGCEERTCS